MKVLKEKNLKEGMKFETLADVREAAWAVANGMSTVDHLKMETERLIANIDDYFDVVKTGNQKDTLMAEKLLTTQIERVKKALK